VGPAFDVDNNNNNNARSLAATMILWSSTFLVLAVRHVVKDFWEMDPEWNFLFMKADVWMLVPEL
jgi:hypothetical protein